MPLPPIQGRILFCCILSAAWACGGAPTEDREQPTDSQSAHSAPLQTTAINVVDATIHTQPRSQKEGGQLTGPSQESSHNGSPADCESISCGTGFHCELLMDEACAEAPCLPEPVCVSNVDAAPLCSEDACGEGAICEMIESDCGYAPCPLEATCSPKACSEAPPAAERCDFSCTTGYMMIDDEVTCSCCAPAEEPDFQACLDDSVCTTGEACDLTYCETPKACEAPDTVCPALCYGRCVAEALVLTP